MAGLFITMEGPDGSGKTTQINLLEQYFKKKGCSVILTREPGGTVISEKIRNIILDKENNEMCDITEVLLYAAARAQHVEQLIKPALIEDKIVLCDRFLDSSIVYQGIGRTIGIDIVEAINKYAVQDIEPNITFLFNLNPEEGIKRKQSQTELDRLELQTLEFHKKVCEGYRQIAKKYSNRIKVINANDTVNKINSKIINEIEKLF